MNRKFLQGRCEKEILWFQRRATIKAAAAWLALGGLPAALAQQRSNIVELNGDALLNGQRLFSDQILQTGDQLQTGPTSSLIFAIGDSAFQIRQNSMLTLERGTSLTTVSQLRLYKGAAASAWGGKSRSQVITPHLTADFQGAGVYVEVFEKSRQLSYLCNCYGTMKLSAGNDKTLSASTYHEAFWATPQGSESSILIPADSINHTDMELEFLAGLINQQTAWQVSATNDTTSLPE